MNNKTVNVYSQVKLVIVIVTSHSKKWQRS